MAVRATCLLLMLALLGCWGEVAPERFDRLSLGLSQAEVEELLGRPGRRYELVWEYRLVGGEHGLAAFDRRGRLTAWLREEVPRLRAGLVPLSEQTYQRLRLGTESEALVLLLGEPVRRDNHRWQYLAPGGYVLTLQVGSEGGLVGKSWVQEDSPHLEGGLLPLSEGAYEDLRLGTEREALVLLLGEPTRRWPGVAGEEGRWHYLARGGYELILELGPEGKLAGKSWGPVSTQEPEEAPEPAAESEERTPTPTVELVDPSQGK